MATDTSAAPPAAASGARSSAASPGGRRRGAAAVLLPLVLVAVAGTLRFSGLGYPERIYFDETYYATQAREFLDRGVEEAFAVHPPLGKLLIAGGIAVAGDSFFGQRAAAAAAGTLTVLVTYLIGLRLFRRRGVAALAALLVAVDGLAFTMSRIAMLDAFLALFIAAGVWLLLVDRDVQWIGAGGPRVDLGADIPPPSGAPPPRPRRWRVLAGVAFGLALATKWSALLAIAGAGLFVVVSEMLWRRRTTGTVWRGWPRMVAEATLVLLVIPLLVYVASYVPWFANFPESREGQQRCPEAAACDLSLPQLVGAWWSEQAEIARFHRDLEAEHPYRSPPVTWLVLIRPVAYYYESCDAEKLAAGNCVTEQDNVEEILGIGNPMVWWAALAAYPIAAWYAVVRRSWPAAVALGFLLVQYLPWLAVPRPNFLFYLTPAVPFVCLTLAYAAWRVGRQPSLRAVPAVVAALAVAGLWFWYPVWTGLEIGRGGWQLRMWLQSWI